MDDTFQDPSEEFEAEYGSDVQQLAMKGTVVKIGSILEELAPQGTRVKKSDILGQEIVIRLIKPFKGKYGKALFVVFTDDNGELFNVVIGSKVLLPKLYAVRDRLPVSCVIVKKGEGEGEYYDIE